jgi:hypothetical protein
VKLADGHLAYPCRIPLASKRVFHSQVATPTGVGFPLTRLVGVICLSNGAVLEAALGPHSGKGRSELDWASALSPGDTKTSSSAKRLTQCHFL